MKIIVDCCGADKGAAVIVGGVMDALNRKDGFGVVLVGKADEISKELNGKYSDRVEIVNADAVITCEEEPVKAIRSKKNSSIVLGLQRLNEDDDCKAFVSAGSTGAVLVGATLKTGRLQGISRPALCPIIPSRNGGRTLLLDSGANADCKPVNLCHFALMGSAYAKTVLGVENPKIALLSNGTEAQKGNQLVHDVYPMLESMKEINFIGNAEGRELTSGRFDVLVTDGFNGNIELKSAEGAVNFLMKELKQEIYSTFRGKLGGLLLKKSFKKLMNRLDFTKLGGAILLGLKKIVIKVHGACGTESVSNAILQAVEADEKQVIPMISEKLSKTDFSQFNAD